MIKKITSSSSFLNFGKIQYRDGEKMLSVADTRKLTDFGFQIRTKLDDGLTKMMELDSI